MKRLLATLAIPFFLTACGSDDATSEAPAFPKTLAFSDDYIATFDMTDIQDASADITVTITDADGNSPIDSNVTVTPLMNMVSGMEHDTPMASRSGPLDENNQFKTTAYFLMPSGPEMGVWSFTVGFDGEEETFEIDVNMMTSEREVLVGTSDSISSMGNETGRPYILFNEARHVTDDMNSFTVFIAARETMMKHTSLVDGITLTGTAAMDMSEMSISLFNPTAREMVMPAYSLMNTSVFVEMCATECGTESNWITANTVADFPGQYKATGLGLSGDASDMINVRLTVNDEIKVKADGSAQYATFTFTDSGDNSGMTHSM